MRRGQKGYPAEIFFECLQTDDLVEDEEHE
jgi:hypothetical protein